jgi:plastocyanin
MLNTAAAAFAASAAAMMAAPARGEFIEVTAEGLPNEGWSVSGNGCNTFNSASCEDVVYSDINAQIGDVLLFEYGQFHDVWLHNTVEQAQECTFGSSGGSRVGTGGQGNQWDSTNNVRGFQYELTEAGDFGFSCSRSGNRPGWPTINRHCAKGQRVIVHVTDPNAAPAPAAARRWRIGDPDDANAETTPWYPRGTMQENDPGYDDITAAIGDVIVFQYDGGVHDVMLLDNQACDFTGGERVQESATESRIAGNFAGGTFLLPLDDGLWVSTVEYAITEPGDYTFVCTFNSHCRTGGMQVRVHVPAPGAPVPETIVVGGSDGWIVKPGNAVYDDITVNAGDTISFEYNSYYHDVMLVDNQNCDFSAGVMLDESGSFDWVAEAGTYTFACTRGAHCSSGNQQITVTVVDCVGDVTGDLIVDVNDLLGLLGAFGQSGGELAADINADMMVDVSDLLTLLGEFGSTC